MTKRNSRYADKVKKDPIVLVAKTNKQKEYIKSLNENPQVVVLGPAGTGKTYIASTFAAKLWDEKKIDKIILTRPNVPSGRSLGFFPGTLEEKMAPWLGPVVDVLNKHLGKAVVDLAIKSENIQVLPFETMRGRSFENALVILDEAQNTTHEEMKMFLTRIGEDTTVIINGDISQSDLKQNSGLKRAISMIHKYDLPVPVVEFTVNDIVRSGLCKEWVKAFIQEEK